MARKSFQKTYYHNYNGGANELADGYSKGTGLGAEIIGTFVLVYTVFSSTDPKRNASDSHVPMIKGVGTSPNRICCVHGSFGHNPNHGTGINPACSFGVSIIYGEDIAMDD
ncbi:hypothetical protein L6452_40480 [Arctium lappa]|uniref:Uncharacterized protein n=1 Tax=Arctium lappa TaxID=4217 RepID=A0ACB8XME0_ARCLA|nr:hypothetical protein L6452_40480 [Arctium lappa]